MATMNISLPDHTKKWVDARVEAGDFSSASDYVRDLVRRDRQQLESIARLQEEIDKGRASGVSSLSPDEIFDQVRERAMAKRKTRSNAA